MATLRLPSTGFMIECPACSSALQNGPDEVFRRSSLYCCSACDLQFWHPVAMPDVTWYEAAYQGRDQHIMPLEPGHRFFLSTNHVPKGGKLMDVGCGTGNFLAAAKAVGFEATGIEFDRNAAKCAREYVGLKSIFSCTLEEFAAQHPQEKFDVITFFEVLEHQDRPLDFLRLVKCCLKRNGYIALSVPNRERWQKAPDVLDYPPNHLTRWNARSLSRFLTAQGFEIVGSHVEHVGVRRAAGVLNSAVRTGMVSKLASEAPLSHSDLSEMKPEEMKQAVQRTSQSHRQQWASMLVAAKLAMFLPVAILGLPYFWLRGYKGLYLSCIARLVNI
jgi:2-polyprenyl-3-methyl-5-hydroxy-6-metoxy-1,4-benzoquinol methylase